jgi:hypothetical protein
MIKPSIMDHNLSPKECKKQPNNKIKGRNGSPTANTVKQQMKKTHMETKATLLALFIHLKAKSDEESKTSS